MSDDYTLDEILLVEDYAKFVYDWYVENKIVQHALSRADYVRGHNQRIQVIFDDLNELRYLLEERKVDQIISHHAWMDEEAKELTPQSIIDYIENLKAEASLIEKDDEF